VSPFEPQRGSHAFIVMGLVSLRGVNAVLIAGEHPDPVFEVSVFINTGYDRTWIQMQAVEWLRENMPVGTYECIRVGVAVGDPA
jgi:hypothetical protein